MAKILIKKEKKEFVKDLNKEILIDKSKKYYIEDLTKDFHSQDGVIAKKDLKKKDGSKILSNTKKEFSIFTSSFIDDYKRIRRGAQIITLKDIGPILAYTGINKNSKVVDAGAGSGALSCYLAHFCKEITTYELRDDFYKIVKENIKKLGLKNIKIKKKNIHQGIDEKDIDLVTLDLPDPWNAIDVAAKALKVGGFLVSYSPTIPQVMDFMNTISKKDNFIHLDTMEVMERKWDVDGRKVRPKSHGLGHTGFLSFCRKIA